MELRREMNSFARRISSTIAACAAIGGMVASSEFVSSDHSLNNRAKKASHVGRIVSKAQLRAFNKTLHIFNNEIILESAFYKANDLTPAEEAAKQVTPLEYEQWSKVNICEEGGNWHVNGPVYGGGLGISRANWVVEGGLAMYGDEALATPDEQIVIAMRIQKNPPDQNGCDGGW